MDTEAPTIAALYDLSPDDFMRREDVPCPAAKAICDFLLQSGRIPEGIFPMHEYFDENNRLTRITIEVDEHVIEVTCLAFLRNARGKASVH